MKTFRIYIISNNKKDTLCLRWAKTKNEALTQASIDQFGTIKAFQKQYGRPRLKAIEIK